MLMSFLITPSRQKAFSPNGCSKRVDKRCSAVVYITSNVKEYPSSQNIAIVIANLPEAIVHRNDNAAQWQKEKVWSENMPNIERSESNSCVVPEPRI